MTTGRINQVSHQFLEQNNNSLALARRSAPGLEKNLGAPTARRRKKTFSADETVCVSLTTLCQLPRCAFCRAPDAECQFPNGTCTAPGQKMRKFEAKAQKKYGTTYKASS